MNNFDRSDGRFVDHIEDFIGETVTIFTTSGGESGSGFTGVIIAVKGCFVRLITQIGPAPGCSLGNACSCRFRNNRFDNDRFDSRRDRCDRFDRFDRFGSVVDIPIDRIASFVHNAV